MYSPKLTTYKEMLQTQAALLKLLTDEIEPLVEEIDISIQPALSQDEIDAFDSSLYLKVDSKYIIRTKVDINQSIVGNAPGYTLSIIWFPGVSYGNEVGLWEVRSWSGKPTYVDWAYEGTVGYCTNYRVLKIIKQLIEERLGC